MKITRVLVIDDDPVSIEYLQEWLRTSTTQVDAATTAAEADQSLHARPYDWLLVDKRLPDADGLQWLRQQLALNPMQRAILLSGDWIADEQVPINARYLRKPVDGDLLLRVLGLPRRVLPQTPMPDVIFSHAAAPDIDDAQSMRALGGNSTAVHALRKMVHAELLAGQTWHPRVEDPGALADTRVQVHRLRASAAMTGCMRLAELCAEIECSLTIGAPPSLMLATEFRAAIARLLIALPE